MLLGLDLSSAFGLKVKLVGNEPVPELARKRLHRGSHLLRALLDSPIRLRDVAGDACESQSFGSLLAPPKSQNGFETETKRHDQVARASMAARAASSETVSFRPCLRNDMIAALEATALSRSGSEPFW